MEVFRGIASVAALAVVILSASVAPATMMVTGRLVPDRNGWLACTVMNPRLSPADVQIEIRNRRGLIVTNYILTERAENGAVARVLAESYDDTATYCRVSVRRGFRRDFDVMLESYDADGNMLEWTGRRR